MNQIHEDEASFGNKKWGTSFPVQCLLNLSNKEGYLFMLTEDSRRMQLYTQTITIWCEKQRMQQLALLCSTHSRASVINLKLMDFFRVASGHMEKKFIYGPIFRISRATKTYKFNARKLL